MTKSSSRERPRNFSPMIALHKICDSPADILRQPNRKRSEPFSVSAILPFTPSRALTPYVMAATDNDRASTIVPALLFRTGQLLSWHEIIANPRLCQYPFFPFCQTHNFFRSLAKISVAFNDLKCYVFHNSYCQAFPFLLQSEISIYDFYA